MKTTVQILVVIEPLLIDEDYYARVEGREIISNLAKAAGLATMISTMRPDIDNIDEYVRNTTARAFAVVASALGIPALLPFLKVPTSAFRPPSCSFASWTGDDAFCYRSSQTLCADKFDCSDPNPTEQFIDRYDCAHK